MERQAIAAKLKEIILPYVEDQNALTDLNEESELVNHLHINSMHLIDVVLDVEDAFDIEVSETEADQLTRVGAVLDLIEAKLARPQPPV